MLLLSLSTRERVRVVDQLVFLPRTFHSFRKEEKGELLAKNMARTARSEYSRPRLIKLTENLIVLDIRKAESNNCFIIHCTKIDDDKHTIARNLN